MRSNIRLNYVADEFAEMFAKGDVSRAVATTLQCTEVEALAELLRAAGRSNAADYWIEDHALDDDCGDMHHTCNDCLTENEETLDPKPAEPHAENHTVATKSRQRWARWIDGIRNR
ncbi:hypothetical protein [Nocardia sp. NPDC051570]|uniref:hypothetical protein n=1 Tax=Nocardia sp. NPDC051570 TaxID=3364324 RepID=UPI0037A26451